jgi:glycosyltransferase involved in cell wall biosynthesis
MSVPKVSIVTPLYNKADYVRRTVDSVLAQTMADWELLVVDNLSTDDGPARVRALNDPRVQLLRCERKGVSATRNTGLEAAGGEWLVFLDADDLLAAGYLAGQLAAAGRNPEADLVVCCYEEFVEGATAPGVIKRPVDGPVSWERLWDSSIVYCPGPQHIFMVRRALLGDRIRWPEDLDQLLGEDACFWFQVITLGRVAFNPEPLARYRIWAPGSRFTTLSDPARLFRGLGEAIKTNLAFLAEQRREITAGHAETLARFHYGIYRDARRAGNVEVAGAALREAQRWLQDYFVVAARPSLAMRMRRLLGFPLFAALFDRPARAYGRP